MMDKAFRNYLAVALIMIGVLLGGRETREQIIKFGCLPAGGVSPANSWMEACASDRVGDYAHSAIWFETEPVAAAAIDAAKVLIFGNSRMEFAVSRGGASEWFADRGIRMFVLAFGYKEQSGWIRRLLAKRHLHPSVAVFDTNLYFTGGQSQPAQAIENDPQGELKTALALKAYMQDKAGYCRYIGWLCGRTATAYRSNLDGHVFSKPSDRIWVGQMPEGRYKIDPPPAPDTSRYEGYLANAQAVLETMRIDPGCVVFTLIPSNDQDDTLARFLALRLGAKVIIPAVPFADLHTVDDAHLNVESSKLWMSAFLDDLQPVLTSCIAPSASKS